MTNLKNIMHEIAHVAHDITQNITHVVHDIADSVRPLGDQIENFFKDKKIKVSREIRNGDDIHNVIANGAGQFSTNNDGDFMRKLLNCVLFNDGGEIRLNNAISGIKESQFIQRVTNPHAKIRPTKVIQLAPMPIDQINEE
jgi:sulfatase maturation enzyme AslB (radical SAM superfamily)